MTIRFDGKVAIVTGGACGIGAACARILAREGAKVAVTDVDDAHGESLVEPAARPAAAQPPPVQAPPPDGEDARPAHPRPERPRPLRWGERVDREH